MEQKNILGYRAMIGKTQKQFAELLNISTPAYNRKEKGQVPFKPNEMKILKEFIQKFYPEVTIDGLFF